MNFDDEQPRAERMLCQPRRLKPDEYEVVAKHSRQLRDHIENRQLPHSPEHYNFALTFEEYQILVNLAYKGLNAR